MLTITTWGEISRPAEGCSAEVLESFQCLKLPDTNSFLRLAIRRQLEIQFPALLYESVDTCDWFRKDCYVLRLTPEEKVQRDQRKHQEKQKSYLGQIGPLCSIVIVVIVIVVMLSLSLLLCCCACCMDTFSGRSPIFFILA